MAGLGDLLKIVAGKKSVKKGGTSLTPTFNESQKDRVLTVPVYRDHLTDIFQSRQADNSQTLMRSLFRHDPDISAAVNGYLTLANTEMRIWATTIEGDVDPEASRAAAATLLRLTRQYDYTLGYQFKPSLDQLNAELRYMLLLRGGIGTELVYDKSMLPDRVRMIDLSTIRWYEKTSGEYKPAQVVQGQSDPTLLDSPTVFFSFYRRDPTDIYTNSTFVSSINTIAARQQVINDLYRIMTQTGYPRLEISIVEEVVRNNAPANVRNDADKMKQYVADTVASIAASFANIRADQAIVHTDSQEFKILNEKNPAASLDITNVVETLNAQNQAALKTMATILGRGSAGVNTGSVEARLAAMYADELNNPLEEMWSRLLSFELHQKGFQGFVNVKFAASELRPDLELEPQRVLKANRLRQDLSDGIISDAQYTLEMYGRLPDPSAPKLSGTGFMAPADPMDPADVSPNNDSTGRSVASAKTKQTKANAPKSKAPSKASQNAAALALLALDAD